MNGSSGWRRGGGGGSYAAVVVVVVVGAREHTEGLTTSEHGLGLKIKHNVIGVGV